MSTENISPIFGPISLFLSLLCRQNDTTEKVANLLILLLYLHYYPPFSLSKGGYIVYKVYIPWYKKYKNFYTHAPAAAAMSILRVFPFPKLVFKPDIEPPSVPPIAHRARFISAFEKIRQCPLG